MDEANNFFGCDNNDPNHDNCSSSAVLTDDDFTYDGTTYTVIAIYRPGPSRANEGRLVFGINPAWPDGLKQQGVMSFGGNNFNLSSRIYIGGQTVHIDNTLAHWTDGQTVSLSLSVAPVSDDSRRKYDWCFNRMSEQACATAIERWEAQSRTISLPAGGHCPQTHTIRTAKSNGDIVCEQSYHPVGAAGGLAEAWGVTEIAPPSETNDSWDGSARPCNRSGHGYYTPPPNTYHGLHKGCHNHGGNFHEHTGATH